MAFFTICFVVRSVTVSSLCCCLQYPHVFFCSTLVLVTIGENLVFFPFLNPQALISCIISSLGDKQNLANCQ